MSNVCANPELNVAWEALRKANALVGVVYRPMLEAGDNPEIGTTLEMAEGLILGAMETIMKVAKP